MAKVAVIVAQGCEEGETLAIVDIMRRAKITCEMVGLEGNEVAGTHRIVLRTDSVFNGSLDAFDMAVLPGGYGGSDAMRDHEGLIEALRAMSERSAWVCAICAAPEALGRAGLLVGKRFTCYPGVKENIEQTGEWVDEAVVIDGNIVTGQGPAFAYQFTYKLVDLLGIDSEVVKQRMVYYNAFADGGTPSWETEAGRWPAPKSEAAELKPLSGQRVAVLAPDGCEESETVQIVDLLTRGGLNVTTFHTGAERWVPTMQGMRILADRPFSAEEVTGYDVIVVPGGRTAAAPLIANDEVMQTLRSFNEAGKLVCGMCSGTTVLEAAGVLQGKRATGYTGYGAKLKSAEFVADKVAVWDANVVTSQGPATPYPFAFKILEAVGVDPQPIKDRLLYTKAGGR